MTDCRLDVLCIGNAIVDVISDTTDAFLDREGLTKGSMRLIDAEEAERLYSHMGPAREVSGGFKESVSGGVTQNITGGKKRTLNGGLKDEINGGVRLDITGDDLIAAGVEPGPALGRALSETLRAKLDGEVEGREDELRYALQVAR